MQICAHNQTAAFLAGELNPDEETAFVRHLDECSLCPQLLERAAGDESQWQFAGDLLRCSREVPESARASSDGPTGTWRPFTHATDEAQAVEGAGTIDLSFLAPTDDPQMIGRMGAYEVSGVIGVGAMGIVLKGFDRPLNRNVAIKVLHPVLAHHGAARRRFGLEARAMAAVSHEQVVAVYAVDDQALLPYFVMEYVPGGTLEKRLAIEGPLGVVEVLRVGLQVARGLAAAHRQGLVHRDIKPSNILLDRGIERVRVADFGLARVQNETSQTRTGLVVGTPQYMSPEQIKGEPCDARSDLFSLGAVLYALCTGHPPFRSDSIYAVMHRIAHDEPRPIREQNPTVPAWLEALIGRLLEKNRELRFQSADEVAETLEQELAHEQNPLGVREPVRAWHVVSGQREVETAVRPGARPAPVPDQLDGNRGKWTFLFTKRRGILAMSILSLLGIGMLGFTFMSPDDSKTSENASSGTQASAPATVDAPETQISAVLRSMPRGIRSPSAAKKGIRPIRCRLARKL
jgi:serine/threonine protein kinase